MTKFIAAAALALGLSLSGGAASALEVIYIPGIWNWSSGGTHSNSGETFLPNANSVSYKDQCEAAGGEPKREIQPDGRIGYRCYMPKG